MHWCSQARNKQGAEEDHLRALQAHRLDRQEYLQSLRSTVNQEEKALAVDNREIGVFLEALKTGAHRIAQAAHRLQVKRLLLNYFCRGKLIPSSVGPDLGWLPESRCDPVCHQSIGLTQATNKVCT